MTKPADMTTFFSDEQLATLRAGYDREAMLKGAVQAVGRHFAGAGPLTSFFEREIYNPEKMAPADRQRCLLALLAPKGHPLTLSVHVYWSLAEGLSLRDIYQVFLLTAAYCGVDAFATAAFTLERHTLPLLARLVDEGGDAVRTPNVLAQLVRHFA